MSHKIFSKESLIHLLKVLNVIINLYYYYTTYGNSSITAVDMNKENLESDKLISFPLIKEQEIFLLFYLLIVKMIVTINIPRRN